MNLRIISKLCLAGAVVAMAVSAPAQAVDPSYDKVPFSFYCVATTDCAPSLSGQLLLQVIGDVNGVDTNTYFKFFNNVGVPSSITQIAFDGLVPAFLNPSGTNGVGPGTEFGVDKKGNGDPANLPAGNNVVPPFTPDFAAKAVSQGVGGNGQPANGINTSGENFEFVTAGNYLNFINQMKSGDLRIGLHVTAMPDGKSATYINNLVPVPEPATWALMIAGLLGMAGIARRRVG